jgi:hypothetical protein
MIDIVNLQFYGFPVLMYAMMIATTGAITYATVYSDKLPSISMPGLPSASSTTAPSAQNLSNGMPGMPNSPAPNAAIPPRGGKRGNKTKRANHSVKRRNDNHSKKSRK